MLFFLKSFFLFQKFDKVQSSFFGDITNETNENICSHNFDYVQNVMNANEFVSVYITRD